MNHIDDPEYEMSREDIRLMGTSEDLRLHNELKKSSLDDPVSDRTVSVVPAHSEKEIQNRDWLAQKPTERSNIQLSDLDSTSNLMIEGDFENE